MAAVETRVERVLRLGTAVWLLAVQPLALALTLDRALPRLATFGAAEWVVVTARIGVVVAAVAVGRRLREPGRDAWHAVAWWALAAVASTMLSQAWPALPSGRAPSEARAIAMLAIGRDALLAVLAVWLARRRDARDSS